jgi:hypothetical protein
VEVEQTTEAATLGQIALDFTQAREAVIFEYANGGGIVGKHGGGQAGNPPALGLLNEQAKCGSRVASSPMNAPNPVANLEGLVGWLVGWLVVLSGRWPGVWTGASSGG